MFKTPFKAIGYYVFDYHPRYYNERKEEIGKLRNPPPIRLHKYTLRKKWERTRIISSSNKRTAYRIGFIIAILCALFYFILFR